MRIAVLGANGRTGRLVVDEALRRGDKIVALARRPQLVEARGGDITIARADALDPESLRDGLGDSEAVISAIGIGTSRDETVVYSQGAANLIDAMTARSIRKIAVVSAAPAGPRERQAFLERRIVMPILDRFFKPTYEDMRRMEALLGASGLDWVSMRPPRLVAKPATGAYRVSEDPLPGARSITYGDLAVALLDSVARDDAAGRAVYVTN